MKSYPIYYTGVCIYIIDNYIVFTDQSING
jgi:hypothetical protein